VVVFTTSPSKIEDAKRLGAHEVVISKNADEMKNQGNSCDLILDCVAAEHDVNPYLYSLKRDGTLVMLGAPEKPLQVSVFPLIMGRKSVAGSGCGGIKETQEMLDFCGKHHIVSDIEMITMSQVNVAFHRLEKQDVKYRFVIDMKTLKENK